MTYKIIPTAIPDVKILEPKIFEDERGFFYESFNYKNFSSLIGREFEFVQDNHSQTKFGYLRGMHYQIKKPQGKLVRVSSGVIFDVAVDMRESSDTYCKWVGVELSEKNKRQLWIPEGFAHGFLAMSEKVDLLYKTTNYWYPDAEKILKWNDNKIGIKWPLSIDEIKVGEKDQNGVTFEYAAKYQ